MILQNVLSCKVLPAVIRCASTQACSYPMRSIFFVKKTRAAIEKVNALQADVVVLDLEDSIAKEDKASVRELYKNALSDNVFDSAKVFIRSSSLSCEDDVQEDIASFTGSGIEGFMLPKVDHHSQVKEVDEAISRVERERGITSMQTKLIPVIETLPAFFTLDKIASASTRNVAIIGGSGDFTADALCEDHSDTYNTYFGKVVLAAKCAGVLPLWGVCDKIDDYAGFYNINHKMRRNGFAGTAALTPRQILMANVIYSLSLREQKWIEGVTNNGSNIKVVRPSVQESRQMIGPPHRVKAENLLKQYISDGKSSRPRASIKKSDKGLSQDIKMGEIVSTPLECTITDGMTNLWESAFLQYSSNRLHTNDNSTLKSVPFGLSTTLAVASSVQCFSYLARAHLGFKNIFQARPLLSGDKVRAMFRVDDVFLKKGGDSSSYAVAKSKHWLVNQENQIVLQLEKLTMFQPDHCSPKSATTKLKSTRVLNSSSSPLLMSLLSSTEAGILPLKPTPPLLAGLVMIHDIVKVMGHSEVRMLCNLLKIVNPHHHNIVRYSATDILVPGPFVMAAAISIASLDIGEVVYEDISWCINPNKVNLGDQIGTLTRVQKCTTLESNPSLQEVEVKHVAIKNTDMDILANSDLPPELFSREDMKPSEYEHLCAATMPQLIHKIVCVLTRRVIRVQPGLNRPSVMPFELQE